MLIANVLGQTELVTGTGQVALGARLARRFATRLVLAGGQAVSDDAIVEAMWGEQSPEQAVASIQSYVSRLRRSLGSERDRLTRWGGGYRLAFDDSDVGSFEQAAARAAAELDRRAERAAASTADALRLWRGEPYADLADAPVVASERARLTEVYETVVEVDLDARLRLGDAAQVVAAAQSAVDAAPYRERRWALLVLALYRTGRQSDALHALRRVRKVLDEELGIDPGPDLQDLERRVFGSDTGLLLDAQPPPPRLQSGVSRPLTTLCGRASDLRMLATLARTERLVTVCGPGGVGKTRLMLEWAADRPREEGPVWLVRLADVTSDDPLAAVVAQSVGLLEVGPDPVSALAAAVRGAFGVLLLDNCEHLVDQVAVFVSRLLGSCDDLRVVATSREPLQVDGEAALLLEPLAIVDLDGSDGAAVELLRDRITRVRPGWAPSATETEDLRRLCELLDGLPLALELAAARARSLSVADIATRLDGRFAALGEAPTGAVTPHRTLADTIAWSTDLLAPTDRELLDRLWPFEGGFDLELALAVAGRSDSDVNTDTDADADADTDRVLNALSSLATKSLVVADTRTSPTRYRLWETVRAYVRDRDKEVQDHRARHAATVAALVTETARVLVGPRSSRAMVVLNRELANVRTMLQHDLEAHPDRALRSFLATGWFWYRAGLSHEGVSWAERLLAAVPDLPAVDRSRLLLVTVPLHNAAGDPARTAATLEACSRALAAIPENPMHGHMHYFRAVMLVSIGRPDEGLAEAGRAVAIGARTHDPRGEINGHLGCGLARMALGDLQAGEAELQVATTMALDGGTPWTSGMAALHLGKALLDQPGPSLDRAEDALRRAVSVFSDEADVGNLTDTMALIGRLLARQGQRDQAEQVLQTAESAARRLGIRHDRATTTLDELHAIDSTSTSTTHDHSLHEGDPLEALHQVASSWRQESRLP